MAVNWKVRLELAIRAVACWAIGYILETILPASPGREVLALPFFFAAGWWVMDAIMPPFIPRL